VTRVAGSRGARARSVRTRPRPPEIPCCRSSPASEPGAQVAPAAVESSGTLRERRVLPARCTGPSAEGGAHQQVAGQADDQGGALHWRSDEPDLRGRSPCDSGGHGCRSAARRGLGAPPPVLDLPRLAQPRVGLLLRMRGNSTSGFPSSRRSSSSDSNPLRTSDDTDLGYRSSCPASSGPPPHRNPGGSHLPAVGVALRTSQSVAPGGPFADPWSESSPPGADRSAE
jgi:hypothetical protein